MKKHLVLLLLAALAITVQAQESSDKPYLVKTLTADAIQQVKAETSGGNISVEGTDTEARIEVYIRPGNSRDRNISNEEIKKKLEQDYSFSVTAENHVLTAIAKTKPGFHNWNSSLSIGFKIFVPHNVSTHLVTSGGNISLGALSGTQDFTTSGGNLGVDHLSGHITGTTSGGNIILSSSQDEINLTTSGGNIVADNSHGKIKLTTSGGSITLHTLQGNITAGTSGGSVQANDIEGELAAHTSGGNIHMEGLSCSLETSTSGGNIDVSIKTLGKYVKIANSGGNTNLQVPQDKGIDLTLYADKVNATALTGFKGNVEKNKIEGTLNGGGVPVTVRGGSRINFTVK